VYSNSTVFLPTSAQFNTKYIYNYTIPTAYVTSEGQKLILEGIPKDSNGTEERIKWWRLRG
jgi:hypothetical protein